MLLVLAPRAGRYELHSGTLFDYLFTYRAEYSARTWRNILIRFHLEGLLAITNMVKEGQLAGSAEIRATSYFFNDQTAHKLGFNLSKPGLGKQVEFVLNYLALASMYSLAAGRLAFPKLKALKTATTTGHRLLGKAEAIKTLIGAVEKSSYKKYPYRPLATLDTDK